MQQFGSENNNVEVVIALSVNDLSFMPSYTTYGRTWNILPLHYTFDLHQCAIIRIIGAWATNAFKLRILILKPTISKTLEWLKLLHLQLGVIE